eukprot:gnl/TRDRNA2_/TRDRNA2_176869_c1_seq1.p1 gnl/TRDRNA2_/TRDRNA2_176869_c1~~gnl/TRDRNA2_/TRDRNA2_176869_c1_seq1.p1  ORF type:complete len:215 (-),score=1.15 gnl/TRDRNA2_/TRDRNA2_176869_c1_seq1:375-1019(-)
MSVGRDSDWQEYIATRGNMKGRKYYYNVITKQSLWRKPSEFVETDELTNWSKHTAPNGRFFYFNKETRLSQWSIPQHLNKASNTSQKILMQNNKKKSSLSQISTLKHLSNSDEASEIYKKMLEEHCVNWNAPWEQALELIANDFRHNNLITSINDRKSIFIAWSKLKEREDREIIRDRLKLVRATAYELLEQYDKIHILNKFYDVEKIFYNNVR